MTPRERLSRPLAAAAGALVALLAAGPAGAASDSPERAAHPLTTLGEIFAALRACWVPPPLAQARPGMEITVRFSFTREGGILGEPRFTYLTPGVRADVRVAYQRAVVATLDRCLPLPFSPALGGAIAGRPFAIRFVDNRTPPGART